MNAEEREKLMSLDQRTRIITRGFGRGTISLKRGEVAIDCRGRRDWSFRRYLWRGPVTGKLYRLDVSN